MTRNLGVRVARLEGQRDTGEVLVVKGHTQVEHDERISELIASGVATVKSLFVCIRKTWRAK